jgi:hypothetical protein
VEGGGRTALSPLDRTGGRAEHQKQSFAPSRTRSGRPMCSSWNQGPRCTSTSVTSAPVGIWGVPGLASADPGRDGRFREDAAIMGRIEPSEHDEDSLQEPQDDPPARRFDDWRRRSAIGAIATGVALGLKEIFQPTNIEPVITAEAPGDPPDAGNRLRVVLDPDDPSKSVAFLPRETGSGQS